MPRPPRVDPPPVQPEFRLALFLQITDIEIDIEDIDEYCRLLNQCCEDDDDGGPPGSGSGSGSGVGSGSGSGVGGGSSGLCSHDRIFNGDEPTCELDFDHPPAWFIEFLYDFSCTNTFPVGGNIFSAADCGIIGACIGNADPYTCIGTYDGGGAIQSSILVFWRQYLDANFGAEVAKCLGIDPPPGADNPTGDLQYAEIEFSGNVLGTRCVEIKPGEECDICSSSLISSGASGN